MKRIDQSVILILLTAVILGPTGCADRQDAQLSDLKRGFISPPLEARPRAYWTWVEGNVQLEEITREMEEARKMGLGGFDIWDVSSVVDEQYRMNAGSGFMSPPSVEAICYAINEAERLGLDLGLIISSGWNAGGIWTRPEHQTMGLFSSDTILTGPMEADLRLAFPQLPDLYGTPDRRRDIIIKRDRDGTPEFYREAGVIAYQLEEGASGRVISGDVIDLSNRLNDEGRLSWEVPGGAWHVVRYVCANTGQPLISSSPLSDGPMIDHFSQEASDSHIYYIIERLEEQLGEYLENSGLTHFYTASYEISDHLWTPRLADDFQIRMGYNLVPYLPALEGIIVKDMNTTSRFLYDFRRMLSDLIIENHYTLIRAISEFYGVGFVAEAAGPGWPVHNCPFESLKSSGALTYPRGEFWHLPSNTEYWRSLKGTAQEELYLEELQVVKGVASASHIYNQGIVEAEAFTGTHLWNEGPGDLKPAADRAFCEGMNRVVFHTWPHTPEDAGTPGWVYPYGTIMNDHRIWWPMAKPWMDYLGRCSYMLQQGNFVGDVLFYYGDSVPNFVPPKHIIPGLGFGYEYDYTNSDILLNSIQVEEGKLVLPHGQSYELLVLPDVEYMQPEILDRVETLIWEGATVLGPRPYRSNGLLDWEIRDDEVRALANQVWGECDGLRVTHTTYGNGHVYWGREIRSILAEKEISPDFDFEGNVENIQLDFIHRHDLDADIYFIRNTTDRPVSGTGTFRQGSHAPEIWDPATGKVYSVSSSKSDGDHYQMPLNLDPYGSLFVVFSADSEADEPWSVPIRKLGDVDISTGWSVDFPRRSGGVGTVEFDSLVFWNERPEEGIRFFSGIATYEKDFEWTGGSAETGERVFLEFDEVVEVAHVYLNNRDLGILWKLPFSMDVTDYLENGDNRIRVEVANTWANGLVGDAKLPEEERRTMTNVTRLPTAWAYPMEEIPNEEYGLLDSGIKGAVKLSAYTVAEN